MKDSVNLKTMPGRQCAVATCTNNKLKLKKDGIFNIIFHCFPVAKDFLSSTILKGRIHQCKRKEKFNTKNAWICSTHFTGNDYEHVLQNELLGLPLRRKLKKTAVPTPNLEKSRGQKIVVKSTETSREIRNVKRRNREKVKVLVETSNFENLQLSASKGSTSEVQPSTSNDNISKI